MVTKSAYTRSLDCPRYAWLYEYRREQVADAIDPQRAWRMEQGNAVERLARQLFPDGRLIKAFGASGRKEHCGTLDKAWSVCFRPRSWPTASTRWPMS